MKRLISLILCMALLFCITGCGQQTNTASTQQGVSSNKSNESNENIVKIGVLNPFTGGSAFQANLAKEGFDYAAKYYNDQGGIKSLGGAKLELVYADTTGVAEVGVTEFELSLIHI